MDRRGNATVLFAVLISILALAISVIAYARRATAPPIPARAPATLTLSMVVATFSGQGMAAHRWFPTMLVVRKGDVVDLAVGNPDKVSHRLEITGYGLKTKVLTPGSTDDLRFVADRDGVLLYHCILPYDPAKGNCTPDHELMRGYLIVTE
ncbi:MAG TPA: hypothetical protein VGR24_02315 [bacterium]|jgi:heme/copper-type cytochrome/quinol oxidase subunit 2|nr:hypothetical protein [bacterium]